ncbi:hypothetical protein [Thalassotalea montiporae]
MQKKLIISISSKRIKSAAIVIFLTSLSLISGCENSTSRMIEEARINADISLFISALKEDLVSNNPSYVQNISTKDVNRMEQLLNGDEIDISDEKLISKFSEELPTSKKIKSFEALILELKIKNKNYSQISKNLSALAEVQNLKAPSHISSSLDKYQIALHYPKFESPKFNSAVNQFNKNSLSTYQISVMQKLLIQTINLTSSCPEAFTIQCHKLSEDIVTFSTTNAVLALQNTSSWVKEKNIELINAIESVQIGNNTAHISNIANLVNEKVLTKSEKFYLDYRDIQKVYILSWVEISTAGQLQKKAIDKQKLDMTFLNLKTLLYPIADIYSFREKSEAIKKVLTDNFIKEVSST